MIEQAQEVTLSKVLHDTASVRAFSQSGYPPDTQSGARFLASLMEKGTMAFIDNVSVKMKALQVEEMLLPLAVVAPVPQNTSYVASPIGQYIKYSREEMQASDKYSLFLRSAAPLAFGAMQAGCRLLGFERVVFVNDWLLSSNLWPSLNLGLLEVMCHQLQRAFPKHAIVFRSVCAKSEASMLHTLEHMGGKPVVSRQVYMLDTTEGRHRKKRPLQQDCKRWEKQNDYEAVWLSQADAPTAARIRRLYEMVYLEKYSAYNPWYREDFVQLCLDSGLMDFQALRAHTSGQIDAVQAIFRRNGVMTTPFIGHDRTLPPSAGLYRHLNALLTMEAEAGGQLLNMSSGASHFKKQRGGLPYFEYNVVFDQHLPYWRRLPWCFWHRLSERNIKPGMVRYEV